MNEDIKLLMKYYRCINKNKPQLICNRAFKAVMERFEDRLYNYSMYITHGNDVVSEEIYLNAWDLVTDHNRPLATAVMNAVANNQDFNVWGYLCTAIRNRYLDYLDGPRARVESLDAKMEEQAGEPFQPKAKENTQPELATERLDLRQRIFTALHSLPSWQGEAVWLHYGLSFKQDEIADTLDRSRETVNRNINEAKGVLRISLAPLWKEFKNS